MKSKALRKSLPKKKPSTTKNNFAGCYSFAAGIAMHIPTPAQKALLIFFLSLWQCALHTSIHAQADTSGEPSGAAFKNVTALSEMPADQMGKVMNIMSASLGVNCQFCHEGFDFAKEHVAHKDIGRKMIEMTLELNNKHFEGRNEVSCLTCHRGQAHPSTIVLFEPAAVAKSVQQPDIKPTIDEIISSYIAGLGGQERLSAITTRHTIAKRVEPDGRSEPEELWQTAEGNHRLVTTYKTAVVTEKFDGKKASKKVNEDSIQLKLDEALQIEREARIAFGLNVKSAFEQLSFTRVELIDDRRAYVLAAIGPSKIRERLYFDEQTGLLTRRTASIPTVLGDFLYQVDYQDYKAFDGIQLPTTLRFSVPNITWTREVISVEHNLP